MKTYIIQKPSWGLDKLKESTYFVFVDIYRKGAYLGQTIMTRGRYSEFMNGKEIEIRDCDIIEREDNCKKSFDKLFGVDV